MGRTFIYIEALAIVLVSITIVVAFSTKGVCGLLLVAESGGLRRVAAGARHLVFFSMTAGRLVGRRPELVGRSDGVVERFGGLVGLIGHRVDELEMGPRSEKRLSICAFLERGNFSAACENLQKTNPVLLSRVPTRSSFFLLPAIPSVRPSIPDHRSS